jgi:hypothetical protein
MPESPWPSDGPATYVPPAYDPRVAAHLVPRPENAVHPMGIVLTARRARPVGRSIAGTVLVAVLAVAGWVLFAPGSEGTNHPAAQPVASGSLFPEPASIPLGSKSGLGAVLESIALDSADLPAGYTVRSAPRGNRIRGEATLDNCGYRFTTEAHRVARRQYIVFDSSRRFSGVANELVAYDGAAQAAKAVAQWHASAAHCPRSAVRSTGAGAAGVVERVSRNDVNLVALPNAPNALTVESGSVTGQKTIYLIAVLQVRGRILDVLFAADTLRPTAHTINGIVRLAGRLGDRLAVTG